MGEIMGVERDGKQLKNMNQDADTLEAGEASQGAEHPLNGAGQQSSCEAEEHASNRGISNSPLNGAGQHSLSERESLSLAITEEQPSLSEPPILGTGEPAQQQNAVSQDLASEVPQRPRLALLIFCIVALNVGAFLVTMYINDCPKISHSCFLPFLRRFSFQPLRENALIGPSSQTLERLGALDAMKVQHAHQGWRLISCIWLHAGVVHVVVNMLSLLFVGVRLEQEFGPGIIFENHLKSRCLLCLAWFLCLTYFVTVKIGIIYILSGLGGSLLSVLFLQDISVGASGALFGLVGAMLAELLGNWTIYVNKCAVASVLVFVVAANLTLGILPYVDNFAHIGGLVVGVLSGLVLLMKPQYGFINPSKLPPGYDINSIPMKARYNAYQYILWITALVLLIIGVTSAAVLVFRGEDGNKKCKWCHYLSCVPTSRWNCHNFNVCDKIQVGDMWQITCTSNQKTTLAPMNQTQAVLQTLCTELCS